MLIEMFTDYIRNRKDLREYVEKRKTIHERGEFNDDTLMKVQENLERLKAESPEIYEKMYEILEELFKRNIGQVVDYPLDFARQVLKMYKNKPVEKIYEEYKEILEHKYQTMN